MHALHIAPLFVLIPLLATPTRAREHGGLQPPWDTTDTPTDSADVPLTQAAMGHGGM